MSILSGIGQIPSIFGGGGGGMTLQYYYEVPNPNINIQQYPQSIFFLSQSVPNGLYLVMCYFNVEIGDSNTNTDELVLTIVTSGQSYAQQSIYNSVSNGKDNNTNNIFFCEVTDGALTLTYNAVFGNNTSNVYTIKGTQQTDGSAGVYAFLLDYPIL